jgi:Putative peptidoglycan binding domain
MKTTKLLTIALMIGAMAASSAIAGTVRTANTRTSVNSSRFASHNWNHNRHYRHHSNVFFGIGLGYPYGYGYGYPYYGGYPYGYGYGYYGPSTTVYASRGINDDATVAAVQRRLARGGYYHGSIDGVIGPATRVAIRSFERTTGYPSMASSIPSCSARWG